MSRVIQNYYDKFLKKEYNFHGIFLYPKMTGNKIIWSIKNPEDKSFGLNSIVGFAQEKFHDYSKFMGDYDYYRLYNKDVCIVDTINKNVGKGQLYFSKNDKKRILLATKTINELTFRNVYFEFEIFDIDMDNNYSDDFYIGYSTNIIHGVNLKTGEKYNTKEKIKEMLCEILAHDDFRDYEYELYNPVLQVIVNNPLLFDNDYMYFTNDMISYIRGEKLMCY
jgi:hypothetical protein